MKNTQTFEQAMLDLEKIVATLDKGDLSLNDMLKQFEQGMKLSQFCEQTLLEAQKKFNDLTQGNENANDESTNPE